LDGIDIVVAIKASMEEKWALTTALTFSFSFVNRARSWSCKITFKSCSIGPSYFSFVDASSSLCLSFHLRDFLCQFWELDFALTDLSHEN
jgi:hypothetical protein